MPSFAATQCYTLIYLESLQIECPKSDRFLCPQFAVNIHLKMAKILVVDFLANKGDPYLPLKRNSHLGREGVYLS